MHVDTTCFIIYYFSPTCFEHFYSHQQGVLKNTNNVLFVFLYFISVHLFVRYIGIKLPLTHYIDHINSHVYFTELQ